MRLAVAVVVVAIARASAAAPAILLQIEVQAPATVRLELSAPVEPVARRLPRSADLPSRIYLDLPGTTLAGPPSTMAGVGELLRVRTGQFDASTARVVLDVDQPRPFTVRRSGRSVIVEVSADPAAQPAVEVARGDVPADVPPTMQPSPTPAVPAEEAPPPVVAPEATRPSEPAAVAETPPAAPGASASHAAAAEDAAPFPLASTPPVPVPPAAPEPLPLVEARRVPVVRLLPVPLAKAPIPPRSEPPPVPPVAELPTPPALEPPPPSVAEAPEPSPPRVAEAPAPPAPESPPPAVAEAPGPPPAPVAEAPGPAAAEPAPPAVAEAPAPPSPEPPPVLAEELPPPVTGTPTPWAGLPVVVLDAGHGGRDPGAEGVGGVVEKDVVLGLARLLAERLPARIPVAVVMTRADDSFVSIDRRLAAAPEGAVFVSLHANACTDPSARGLEVFYGGGAVRQASTEGTSRRAALLGWCIREALSTRVGPVRGAPRPGDFRVLTQNPVPSALVEIGYLTHPAEAERARDAGYQALLADALIEGIAAFLRASAPPPL